MPLIGTAFIDDQPLEYNGFFMCLFLGSIFVWFRMIAFSLYLLSFMKAELKEAVSKSDDHISSPCYEIYTRVAFIETTFIIISPPAIITLAMLALWPYFQRQSSYVFPIFICVSSCGSVASLNLFIPRETFTCFSNQQIHATSAKSSSSSSMPSVTAETKISVAATAVESGVVITKVDAAADVDDKILAESEV